MEMHIAIAGVAVTVPAQGTEGSVGRGGVFQYEQSIPPA
jgi:hypothetical protein